MTLLITVFAAIVSTLVWYCRSGKSKLDFSLLCLMYWGASLMWLVDALVEYAELGVEFFTPATADMLNDAFLGISVVALGLIVWLIDLLIKGPKSVIKNTLLKKNQS